MIAHLQGELSRVEPEYAVIDVGGVGYKVNLPLSVASCLPAVGEKVRLLVTTIVREDSITLYGFSDEFQQSMFELLIGVSGVGPRLALNILSIMTVEQIVHAISNDSYHELNRVPGVGTKTAQRIIIELREKIGTSAWAQEAKKTISPEKQVLDDAVEGLIALGYSRNDARAAAEKVLRSGAEVRDTGGLITAALKLLSK
ncbi:MAG: Holliday junction branch migration protein RuvA [Armatimonadetes bacterium]|nr:Holliday junction branch migration protein RuvA [Armatimonadota bacterium]